MNPESHGQAAHLKQKPLGPSAGRSIKCSFSQTAGGWMWTSEKVLGATGLSRGVNIFTAFITGFSWRRSKFSCGAVEGWGGKTNQHKVHPEWSIHLIGFYLYLNVNNWGNTDLSQQLIKDGPAASSTHVTWEPVRNASLWNPLHHYWNRNSGGGPRYQCFNKSSRRFCWS